ncbi:thermonuclease family protein [Desulfovibrio sp.]|uniref:thermonuclease family protein n=1 Tax=Desulfovibrio sp. TaxID=885 RepID=UPI0023C0C80D|nr:thermonuclease family protein [Desulfovibrio sp.]MDE7242244.1 thermonuclease family protein [Desulfovibrio sp.]
MRTDAKSQAARPWRGLCAAVALLGLLLCAYPGLRAEEQPLTQPDGMVAHCFDGDTFKLRDRRVVRLAGIDSPELGRGETIPQYYAREAKAELERLTRGQQVSLYSAGVSDRDRHGRLVADVRLADGRSLNDLMVASGAAFFYPHRDLGPEFQERLRDLQAEAIRERRGLWAHLLELPLAQETYVGNRGSLRFFPVNCPEARHIKPRNRVHFGTLMDAFLAGYAPARVCLFWPDAR